MSAFQLQIRDRQKMDLGSQQNNSANVINRTRRQLINHIRAQLLQEVCGAGGDSEYVFTYSDTDPTVAATGLAISGGSGTVGATLNGVATTVTYATSDTNAAAQIAAAINTSTTALVQAMFNASNLTATITASTGVTAGMTVDVCGFRLFAVDALAPNSYGGASMNQFVRSAVAATVATNLAACINGVAGLSRWVYAVPVGAVVRLFARKWAYTAATNTFAWPTGNRVPTNNLWSSDATNLAVSGSALAAWAFVGICAGAEGQVGNCHSIAASGTGVSVLNGETRLMRGVGFDQMASIADYT